MWRKEYNRYRINKRRKRGIMQQQKEIIIQERRKYEGRSTRKKIEEDRNEEIYGPSNKKRKILINTIKEKVQMILNTSYEKEEGWTNIREIEILAIDYMTVNDKVIDKVDIVKKENRMQSDHTPLEM